MDGDLLKLEFSAETKQQARDILNALIEEKLVTGGQLNNAPARFWWKGKIIDIDYYTVTSFTLDKHKQSIITVIERLSIEEVPMIAFMPFTANEKLSRWIKETVR